MQNDTKSLKALRMIWLSSCFLKNKRREILSHDGSIQSQNIERTESSPSLLRISGIITVDSKITSGFQWLSLMPAILEPHIKKKTTNFCELSVLCAARWSGWTWQSPFWILAFACTVTLNCQNTSQNACHGWEKRKKNVTPSEFFYDGQKFWRQCVNVIDITWGRIYFSTCKHFGLKFRTQCTMTFKHHHQS